MLNLRYSDYEEGQAPQILEDLHTLFQDNTDIFIIVSGEYNSTMQPGLMNLMDHFYSEYTYKPCGIVTYSGGILGGARVSMQLPSTLCTFGLTPMGNICRIGKVQDKFDENNNIVDEKLTIKIDNFLEDIELHAEAFIKIISAKRG